MYQKIILALILVGSSVSYARGGRPPRLSVEAVTAIEDCGLSLPERGQRPSREERQAIQTCLSDAGVEMPARPERSQRSRRANDDSGSQAIQ